LAGQLAGALAGLVAGWLAGLDGWLAGWLALTGWLAGWLAGQLTDVDTFHCKLLLFSIRTQMLGRHVNFLPGAAPFSLFFIGSKRSCNKKCLNQCTLCLCCIGTCLAAAASHDFGYHL